MTLFHAALWAEALKAYRSAVPWWTALGFSLAPLVDGLFMYILQDPERARSLGLISAKAQLVAGVADWPTFFNVLAQAVAVGGGMLFAFITAWVFGREFSDHTVKGLLAIPTPRLASVGAKFVVVALWVVGLVNWIFVLGLGVGTLLALPGWSSDLLWRSLRDVAITAGLTLALMPPVALMASAGRGYLPALGWAILTIVLAQIMAATGWGAWFPWSVPALFSQIAGPRAAQIDFYSYAVVAVACAAGLIGTCFWWLSADQAR